MDVLSVLTITKPVRLSVGCNHIQHARIYLIGEKTHIVTHRQIASCRLYFQSIVDTSRFSLLLRRHHYVRQLKTIRKNILQQSISYFEIPEYYDQVLLLLRDKSGHQTRQYNVLFVHRRNAFFSALLFTGDQCFQPQAIRKAIIPIISVE